MKSRAITVLRLPEHNWRASPRVFAAALALVFLITAFACTGADALASLLILWKLCTDGLLTLLWLVSATGWGSAILHVAWAPRPCARRESGSRMERASITFPLPLITSAALGLGLISLATLALGLAGALNPITAWSLLLIGLGLAIWRFFPRKRVVIKVPLIDPSKWLWLFASAALAIAAVAALMPPGVLWGDEPNGYDVLEYHLQVPREWYELHRIVPLTHNVFSYFPFNVEMHYLLAMTLRGGPWAGMYLAQLMHVSFLALTVAVVHALLAERSKTLAVVAAVAVAAVPWTGLLAPVAYNEGGLLLWSTLAIGLTLRAPSDWRNMALAGLFAGFACGTKLTAVPTVLLPVPIVILLLDRARPRAIRAAAVFVLAAAITFSPWLIRNIAWTRNPVFPEATSLFGRAHWSATQVERWKQANHLPRPDQQNPIGRIQAARDQVITDWRFGFLLLPLAGIAAFLSWSRKETRALLLLFAWLAIFWLCFTHLQSRFFTLAIPVAALLVGQMGQRRWEIPFTAIAISMAAVFGLTLTFMKLRQVNDGFFKVIGAEDLIGLTPLADAPPPRDARVVLVGEARAFLYSVPTAQLWYRTVFDVDIHPGESTVDAWRRGVPASPAETDDVIAPAELDRFSRTYRGIPPTDFVSGSGAPYVVREAP